MHNSKGTAAEFEDGYWKCGDMGYIDEQGFLYIVDRKKDVIITGGFNVHAIEVEAALKSHPAVQMSVVVGVPHEEWGEAVHAEVVLRADAQESRRVDRACQEPSWPVQGGKIGRLRSIASGERGRKCAASTGPGAVLEGSRSNGVVGVARMT
jgi:acyl-CoA synthetase (AMP-forming)/AMP-acid ligase II